MSCSIPALPGGSPPFPASQVHLYLTRRLPGAIPFLCMCPLGSPPAPSPCPRSCYRCLHTHGSQPEDRVGTSNAQHLFWRLTDGDKYNHSLCWSFSQSILLVFFVVFFLPPPIHTPSLCKPALQAVATCSILWRRAPFLSPHPGGQQLLILSFTVPSHCTTMQLLGGCMTWGCSSSFGHLLVAVTTQGEVTSGAPSSDFTIKGSELHSQEESQAALVLVACCRPRIWAGVTARAREGGMSHNAGSYILI